MHRVPENFVVLSGDDAMTLPVIALGGRGVISVVSNQIPGAMTELTRFANEGHFDAARKHAAPLAAADAGQLRRIKSDPGEMGHVRDGPAGPCISTPDGRTASRRVKRRSSRQSRRPGCWPWRGLTDCNRRLNRFSIIPQPQYTPEHFALFARFKEALNAGAVRAAEPDTDQASGWRVNGWVKKGILIGFRMGSIVDMSIDDARQPFFDKIHLPRAPFRRG